MKDYVLNKQGKRGIAFRAIADSFCLTQFLGLPGAMDSSVMEANGLFFLHTDLGRFEDKRFLLRSIEQSDTILRIVQETIHSEYEVKTVFTLDEKTGVISRKDYLTNRLDQPSIIYSCLPRIGLQGDQFELYGQNSGWCAENDGAWTPLSVGDHVLTNSAGRAVDSAAPFACIRHKQTGLAAAIHVLPVGDWIIQARRVSGHRNAYLIIEAGLSNRGLHMTIEPGETLALPELLFYGFREPVENCSEPLQRYLLERYNCRSISDAVYNSWLYDFDTLDAEALKKQVLAAKELGCRVFVVDAGWFGTGVDWENQVGCWEECTVRAFYGKMREFSDFVRSQGMQFGLWMEPERACKGTEVYESHPEWFLPEDAIVYNLTNPEVREYICDQLTALVRKYELRWMKLDFNSDMRRDRTGSNYYRYFWAERQLMKMICDRNPSCTFEGCAAGGLRSDFDNALQFYHGFFASDTPNPLEILRIRQNLSLRMLPSYAGSWLVLQEVAFPVNTYQVRNRDRRTKVFSCGDGWWQYTVDVSADFAAKINLMGEFGLNGDLTSYSAETAETVRNALEFYNSHRDFMGRSICHLLTKAQPLNDITGWTAVQYENVDQKGSILFVFRLVDNAESFIAFPRNLLPAQRYRVVSDGDVVAVRTGADLAEFGVMVTCSQRYAGQIVELIPCE